MKWFGLLTPFGEEEPVIPTPVGTICGHCEEPIERTDSGCVMPHFDTDRQFHEMSLHRECFLRGIFGSVAHQEKMCSCYGGHGEDDPSMSLREAARAAVDHYYRYGRGRL